MLLQVAGLIALTLFPEFVQSSGAASGNVPASLRSPAFPKALAPGLAEISDNGRHRTARALLSAQANV